MILFRKLYKEANDDITPSEELLNKTIENAFSGKKKHQHINTYYAAAAAVVILIGSSAAIPKLMEKPQTEQTSAVDVLPQASAPVQTESPAATIEAAAQTPQPEANAYAAPDAAKPSAVPAKKSVPAAKPAERSTAPVTAQTYEPAAEQPDNEPVKAEESSVQADTAYDTADSEAQPAQTSEPENAAVQDESSDDKPTSVREASGASAAAYSVGGFVSVEEYSEYVGLDVTSVIEAPEGFETLFIDAEIATGADGAVHDSCTVEFAGGEDERISVLVSKSMCGEMKESEPDESTEYVFTGDVGIKITSYGADMSVVNEMADSISEKIK